MSIALKFQNKNIQTHLLDINPENLRFRGGSVQDGVKVTDTYNLATMKDDIRKEGGVLQPLVVEEYLAADGSKRFKILAGNRRGAAAQEMLADTTLPADLLERLKSLSCNVYKDLTDRQRRDLVNDQRSQKYMQSEIDVYAWKLQFAGMTYPEIAMYLWQQMATYSAGGARKIADIERCGSEADRKKEILTWLKGNLDNIILTCGKLGPRVRRALLLHHMYLDGISPVLGKDDKDVDILEMPEFKPTQGRCGQLRKVAKEDPTWTAEKGSDEFNALIATYIREDKGLDKDGNPVAAAPTRASADLLQEQIGRTNSNAAKYALYFASGDKRIEFADIDAEAFRVQKVVETAVKCRNEVKNPLLVELLDIFIKGTDAELTLFLSKHVS